MGDRNPKVALQDAESCKNKGNKAYGEGDYKEALSWYDMALRLVHHARHKKKLVMRQVREEKDKLDFVLHLNIAQCCLKLSPPDQLRALRAATSALEVDPVNEKALYRRAMAFAIPGTWQSLSRFEADLAVLKHYYPDSESTKQLEAMERPPSTSDNEFGSTMGLKVGSAANDESYQDAEARERQKLLREHLKAEFSNNLNRSPESLTQPASTSTSSSSSSSSSSSTSTSSSSSSSSSSSGKRTSSPAGPQKGCCDRVKAQLSAWGDSFADYFMSLISPKKGKNK